MTPQVKAAIDHVCAKHPDVTQVFYGTDGRWLFCGDAFESPTFGPEIDVSILEAAADSLTDFPAAFRVEAPVQGETST